MNILERDQQLHCRAAAELISERMQGHAPTLNAVRGHARAEVLREDVLETLLFGYLGDLFDEEFVPESDALLRWAHGLAREARGGDEE